MNSNSNYFKMILCSLLLTLIFSIEGVSQIEVWNNHHVTIGYATTAPNQRLSVGGDCYMIPNGSSSGFEFTNYYHNLDSNHAPISPTWYNEPLLKPQWPMSMWLGNASNQLYSVYSRTVYTSLGYFTFSDRRLKSNIYPLNDRSNILVDLKKIGTYPFDLDPTKFGTLPEESRTRLINGSKNKIGFIAQEINEVFPEMVSMATEDGYLAVD